MNKLVALWIGPVGFGLFSLYNAAIDMLRSATSLGIRNSSVRDIAIAAESGDETAVGRTISIVKRWAWFISIFGAVTTMALAPLLSRWSFGDTDHLWDFVLLSSALLFSGFAYSEQAILQGTEQMKRLAGATLAGIAGGLFCSIPLFYFLREDSILLSVIVYHIALLVSALIFRHKKYKPVKLTNRQAVKEGAPFIRLGLLMTLSDFITMLFSYIFSAYLNRTAGTQEVGFYQAGFSLVGRYVGLIFTALSMEYYPRLARIHQSRIRLRAFVSLEINMLMLMLLPAVSIFLVAREFIISFLYSGEFRVIAPYISWAIVGTVFKAYSWCMAMVILAKGDGKTFLITESLSATLGLAFNIAGYRLWGLEGIGIAYIAWYAAYCIIIGTVYFRRYRISLSGKASFVSLAAVLIAAGLTFTLNAGHTVIGILAAAVICTVSALLLRRTLRTG